MEQLDNVLTFEDGKVYLNKLTSDGSYTKTEVTKELYMVLVKTNPFAFGMMSCI